MAVDLAKLNTDVDAILALVPADQREAARAHYSRLADAAKEIAAVGQTVHRTAQEQAAWWEANKDAVSERNELRTKVTNTPNNAIQNAVDQAALDKSNAALRDDILGTGLGLITTVTNIAVRHAREFGEDLDTSKLAKDALAAGQPLDQFYANSVAARRKEVADAATKKREEEIRAEGHAAGVKEILSRTNQGMPYPVGNSAPTTLTGLKKPDAGAANPFSLDAAVATANAVAQRQTGT